nr:hypothetical protein Iba_chr10bCG2790 [Ipomoea batatas]GMD44695.1 hypothetical protein Iba_chr10dCG2960 [Ipomoea batatas]GMD46434.1 hypothetical protein Iba_chr10eCG3240 [Ipomoea batatas]GMD47966.1 hypothetical protein Iba_chr10fCG1890 [Ipomoea batatas]GME08695.1 hypothetical protein Iba_scaffold7998CG0010 [Ipomoea batatas]
MILVFVVCNLLFNHQSRTLNMWSPEFGHFSTCSKASCLRCLMRNLRKKSMRLLM